MKIKELRGIRTKETSELMGFVNKKRLEIAKILAEVKAGKERNLKKVKNLRREVAQILTVVKEKEILVKEKIVEESKKESNL